MFLVFLVAPVWTHNAENRKVKWAMALRPGCQFQGPSERTQTGLPNQWKPASRQLRPSPIPGPKVDPPKHQPLSSNLTNPHNHAYDLLGAQTLHQLLPPNGPTRRTGEHQLYRLRRRRKKNRCTRATTKTKKASRGTVTVTKLVSGRWLRAIMMLVRGNGSICRVWE